jgi:hypothetical protein
MSKGDAGLSNGLTRSDASGVSWSARHAGRRSDHAVERAGVALLQKRKKKGPTMMNRGKRPQRSNHGRATRYLEVKIETEMVQSAIRNWQVRRLPLTVQLDEPPKLPLEL